jgi:DNA-binding response OmpR family regulator
MPRVLIIDDDQKLCRLIRDYLEPLDYSVDMAHTGVSGLEKLNNHEFDAIILDVMLPELNGLEVLKKIRHTSEIPILMLTGRGEEADRIVGLELGADDYLPKTFSIRELLARLRAITRRSTQQRSDGPNTVAQEINVLNLSINTQAHIVSIDKQPLTLTPVEYDLLLSLASNLGRVRTRDQLLDEVAGRDYEVFDRSIDVHISALRRKLADDPKDPRFIKTVRSVGYIMPRPE